MVAALVQIDGYDPVTAAAVTLRAATHDDPGVCHVDGQTWWPVIEKLPTLRYDLFDGAFGGQISAPTSSLSIGVEPWQLFGRFTLADARFRLWTGEPGASFVDWTLRFDGRISGQPRLKDGMAQIDITVDDRWLDTSLLALYAGTTGAEGPAALKGQPKPLALGAPRYVPGKLVDAVNNVFQISAYGAIHGITAALERLARYGTPMADYPTYAALVAAAIPAGRWATALAVGMVRFGAPTQGQVSFLVEGDEAGPDGWARRPGEVIRRLALLSGGTGKIDDTSLDALDGVRPYDVSVYQEGQITARQLIQRVATSVNAVAGVSWLGKLFTIPVEVGTPSMTLAADGSAMPQVRSIEQITIDAPWKSLMIGAERAWSVHALADIAFTAELVDVGAYAAGTTYREGNIVQDQGSSWLYINPAPSAGNAPPTLPAIANAWWKVLAKAGTPGDPGVDALSVSAAPEAHTVSCDFGGTPKTGEASKASTLQVLVGASDVTSSSTIAVTGTSGCSASAVDAVVTLAGFVADSGYADVSITRGASVTAKRITFGKSRDGAPGASATIATTVTSSASWTDSSATLTIATQGAGTLSASTSWRSTVSAFTKDGGTRILYREAGTSTWLEFASGENSAPASEPFSVQAYDVIATTDPAKVYEFKVQTYRNGTFGTITPGRLNVSWQPG